MEPVAKVHRRRRGWWLGALLAVGVAASLAARPTYAWLKSWRGRDLAGQSLKLSEGGQYSEAASKAQAAYRLIPGEPESTRALATALMGTGEVQQAGAFWEHLVASGQATARDHLALTEAHLQVGHFTAAQEQLERAIALSGENVPTLLFSARLKGAAGDRSGALTEAQRAAALAPADVQARTLVATLKLESAATATEAEQELRALGAEKTEAGLHALVLLATSPALSIQGTDGVAAALEAHPQATEIHRLKALELHWRARPLQREALVEEAEVRYRAAGTDPQMQAEFAGLLLRLGEPERLLKFLPLEQALSRREWLILHLDALSALRRWEEIVPVLKGEPPVLPKPIVELYRARCADELGDPPKAKEHWRLGISGAAGDAGLLVYLAQYAEKLGRMEEARSAYRALQQVSEAASFARQQLVRLERQ